MTNDPVSLLIQGGLVGVFMLYVILTRRDDAKERAQRDIAWQTFIDLQNKSVCSNQTILAQSINKLVDKFDLHEKKSDSEHAVLMDRKTSPRKPIS